MADQVKVFCDPALRDGRKVRMAIFLSGTGSNAEKLLRYMFEHQECEMQCVVLVTDAPATSRAKELGAMFQIPVEALDLKQFYRERGQESTALRSDAARRIREEWTDALRRQLQGYQIEMGVLAGFVPLTNLTEDFPCLNVHPGDLTVVDPASGKRCYVGLHTKPIEAAILNGEQSLRSSVIIALPYRDAHGDMDNGLLLGVSQPLAIDFSGKKLEDLRQCQTRRPARKPAGGWNDDLSELSAAMQEELKIHGDHVVLPPVTADFAAGRFGYNEQTGQLWFRESAQEAWRKVAFLEYGADGVRRSFDA